MPSASPNSAWLEISLKAVTHNASRIKSAIPANVHLMAVVKGEGYGHGAVQVAKSVEGNGFHWFGVASGSEGLRLKVSGIGGTILVLGRGSAEDLGLAAIHKLRLSVYSKTEAERLVRLVKETGKRITVHIRMDSGGIAGVEPKSILETFNILNDEKNITVEGIFAHAAPGLEQGTIYTDRETDEIRQIFDRVQDASGKRLLKHMASTAVLCNQRTDLYLDMVRVGGALYGMNCHTIENNEFADLMSAMTLKARIIRLYEKGAKRFAVLGIGTSAGLPALLAEKGHACVDGKLYRIVGVSPTETIIELESQDENIGQEVVLLGDIANGVMTIERIAEVGGVSPLELAYTLGQALPRYYD